MVVTAASALLEAAQPVLENVDVAEVAAKARSGVTAAAQSAGKAGKAVGDAAGKAGKAVGDAAGNAAGTVNGIFSKLGDVRDGIFEDLAKAKSEKELRQAIKDARQTVLENATSTVTVAELIKAQKKTGGGGTGRIADIPGCFVIATYKKMDFDKDLTDYTGIYVGRADNVAEGLRTATSKDGDADVYADIKYKQNVHVYIYNRLSADLDERYVSLSQTFSDDRLYC